MFGIGMKLGRVAAVIGGLVSTILDSYAVNGKTPGLVVDSNGSDNDSVEVYNAGGTKDTFAEVITHSRAGQATMTDSDGNLKWAPHNLLTYSEDLTGTGWSTTGTVADSFTLSLSGNNSLSSAFTTTQVGVSYTVEVELWTETHVGEQVDFGFNTNNLSNTFSAPVTLTATPTTYSFSKSNNTATQNGFRLRNYGGTTKTVKVSKVRLYRSDLGGMVDNPDRSDSYVPTTSSAVYLPRRNHHVYNGDAWVNEGILHESEARTNLVTYSQDFTDASWTKSNTGTLALDATGPDGQANSAVTLVDSGATGTGVLLIDSSSLTVPTSTNYTISIFAKADQLSWMRLGAQNFTSNAEAWFDLSTGSVGTTAGAQLVTQGIEDCGNGWYRCHVVFTSDATDTTGNIRIVVGDGDNDATVDFDGTSSILIYGAQFEAGSTPSSYIPTSGASSSRAAETLTIPAANLPWPTPIDPQSVSLQMAGRMTYADDDAVNTVIMHRWLFTGNDQIQARLNTASTNTGTVELFSIAASVSDSVSSADVYAPGVFVPFNIASRHGSTFINGAVDGVALTANTTPTALPDLSATDLNLGYEYMGTISEFRIWAADIADTGLVDATSP